MKRKRRQRTETAMCLTALLILLMGPATPTAAEKFAGEKGETRRATADFTTSPTTTATEITLVGAQIGWEADASLSTPMGRTTTSPVRIYPGIDFRSANSRRSGQTLEFAVTPGFSAEAIRLDFGASTQVAVDGSGALRLIGSNGERIVSVPVAFQASPFEKRTVEAAYKVAASGTVTLSIGEVDDSWPLVIRMVLAPSSR